MRIPLTGLLLLSGATHAVAQNWCTNSDIVGLYAFWAHGSVIAIPGVPVQGPFARIALVQADGNGFMNVPFERANYSGAGVADPFTATYDVKGDCRIAMLATPPPPVIAPVPFIGAFSDKKNEAKFVVNGTGVAIRAVLEKTGMNWCSNGSISGPFQLDLTGGIVPPLTTAGPFARSGRVVFDGSESFRAVSTASYNGQIRDENFTGAYSISNRCILKMTYDYPAEGDGKTAYTIEGVLTGKGQGAFLIYTAPQGIVMSGTLRAQ